MEELTLLQQKLTALLKQYSVLKAERVSLQKAISQQDDAIRTLHLEKERLQRELDSSALAQSVADLDHTQKARLRQQLDKVLEALKKNIDLLK